MSGILGMMGGQMLSSGLDIAMQPLRDTQQREHMDRAGREAMRREKEMAEFYDAMSMKRWEDTNYKAQAAQMRKAGLNVGMMYGGSGAGGATTQVTKADSGGQSPNAQPNNGGMGMMAGIQAQLTQAQIENIKADTRSKEVTTEKTAGADTSKALQEIEKMKAETTNEKERQRLINLETMIREEDASWKPFEKQVEMDKASGDARQSLSDAEYKEKTVEDRIEQERTRSAGMVVDNILKNEQVNLNRKQQWQLEQAIAQKWGEISLYDTEVNIKIAQAIINGIGTVGGLLQAGKVAEAMKQTKKSISETTPLPNGGKRTETWRN